jgi:hypothetical protein
MVEKRIADGPPLHKWLKEIAFPAVELSPVVDNACPESLSKGLTFLDGCSYG